MQSSERTTSRSCTDLTGAFIAACLRRGLMRIIRPLLRHVTRVCLSVTCLTTLTLFTVTRISRNETQDRTAPEQPQCLSASRSRDEYRGQGGSATSDYACLHCGQRDFEKCDSGKCKVLALAMILILEQMTPHSTRVGIAESIESPC